jgi:hypothetical protein
MLGIKSLFGSEMTLNSLHSASTQQDTKHLQPSPTASPLLLSLPEYMKAKWLARAHEWSMDKYFESFRF